MLIIYSHENFLAVSYLVCIHIWMQASAAFMRMGWQQLCFVQVHSTQNVWMEWFQVES